MASEYWTVSKGPANRIFNCRECKGIIYKNAPMVCRDGRKLRLYYHEECFSGEADPRTQANSSYNKPDKKFSAVISPTAPARKGTGKWSTSYGYQPNLESVTTTASSTKTEKDGSARKSRGGGEDKGGGDGDGGSGRSIVEGLETSSNK